MATANDIITRAMTRLGIRGSETALQADELQDGLSLLNDMLAEWEPIYQLGFSPVAKSSAIINVPRFANMAVIENLAVRMAPEYSRPISPALGAAASESLKSLLNITTDLSNVGFPSTLPSGSGNEDSYYNGTKSDFFPQNDKANF